MLPQPTKAPAPSSRPDAVRRQSRSLSARRHSRSELLRLVASMARELEQRAASPASRAGTQPSQVDYDAMACLRAARHLREVLSIADGRKSAAYWQQRRVA